MDIRQLDLHAMAAAALVHRAAFDDRLPWLAGLHTPAEDRWFYRERVFAAGPVWGAYLDGALAGIMACRADWVDQLYVLPSAQGRGLGSALLQVAQNGASPLFLHTFQRNLAARRFYERRGFVLAASSDGADNEEREPDLLYRWDRA